MSGTTLCPRHARQVARLLEEPEGPCSIETWLGGDSQVVTCDVVANPPAIVEYLRTVRSRLRAGRQATNEATSPPGPVPPTEGATQP